MKQIKDFPNYSVTEDGRVWSHISNKYLKFGKASNGYNTVNLGAGSNRTVHRIVAETLIPNPEGKPCVNHIDGDKLNNRVSNLEWCTYAENNTHAILNGLKNDQGELSKNSKLTNEQVVLIRELYKSGVYQRDLASKYSVDQGLISKIVNYRIWKNV